MTVSNLPSEGSNPLATQRPAFKDYTSLWLTILARKRRKHLTSRKQGEVKDFYEGFFAEKDVEEWSKDERRNVRRKTILDYLARHAPSDASVLDVGCGIGEMLAGMPADYSLHGMEYSESNVHTARKILANRAEVKQGDIYAIPYETGAHDVCLCLEVLEHIEDDARGVREISRVLKPGAILIAAVPSTYYWPKYKKLIGHHRHYTRQSFTKLLECNGLIAEDYLPNYPNWHLAYSRRYVWDRFLYILFARFMKQRDAFEFKWPWAKEPLLEKVRKQLEPTLEEDGRLDYPSMDSSTFVAARKPSQNEKGRPGKQSRSGAIIRA